MTFMVPLMLYGWIPISILFFLFMPARKAVLFSVIGGVLFLPSTSYDIAGIPEFSNITSIALGTVIGHTIFQSKKKFRLSLSIVDVPMLMWCFFCPIATSLSNHLGLYDGLSSAFTNYIEWGCFFWIGRRYFYDKESIQELLYALIIGGLIYVPLCLFEIRMSPSLSQNIYGFFAHSWRQHIRYGGYRPIVFMIHGLTVALWMASAFAVTLWTWNLKVFSHVWKIRIGVAAVLIFITTVLCKSANGWSYMLFSIITLIMYRRNKSTLLLKIIMYLIPIYIVMRIANIVSIEQIGTTASLVFDDERIHSLMVRLNQEDLFGTMTMKRPLFGWGGYNRGWPVDSHSGEFILSFIDSYFVIYSNQYGFLGLFNFYAAILVGPWLVLRKRRNSATDRLKYRTSGDETVVLSLIVLMFALDTLLNGPINPVYIMLSGSIVSAYLGDRKEAMHGNRILA